MIPLASAKTDSNAENAENAGTKTEERREWRPAVDSGAGSGDPAHSARPRDSATGMETFRSIRVRGQETRAQRGGETRAQRGGETRAQRGGQTRAQRGEETRAQRGGQTRAQRGEETRVTRQRPAHSAR
jgi:hypothetical protein